MCIVKRQTNVPTEYSPEITHCDFKLGRGSQNYSICLHRARVAMLSSVLRGKRAIEPDSHRILYFR